MKILVRAIMAYSQLVQRFFLWTPAFTYKQLECGIFLLGSIYILQKMLSYYEYFMYTLVANSATENTALADT